MPNLMNTDKVIINDLIVEMSAGIYDHEKANKQRVIFNVTLDVSSNKDRELKSIDDVTSYENVCEKITFICNQKHYDLLEVLVEIIAQECLKLPHVGSVNIKAEKPDIIPSTKSVGVEIFRSL